MNLFKGRSTRAAAGFAGAAALLFAVAPLALSDFRLGLLAKYLCTAMVAVGICLAWGRGGLLTLGQGVFFGLGGYAMAMHLKLDFKRFTSDMLLECYVAERDIV
ncbi:hypothetical protein ACWEWQ_34025, partial [Streptomyces sp. NPDC003832]